jgi:threonylcarbamoyladenosine tRNA methylthiotransferase MtaB
VKRVSFKTLGCRLNQAETAQMAGQYKSLGYSIVPFDEPCDICVIHTCAVTRKAEQNCLRIARAVKRASPETFTILAGCAVEINGERLKQESGADAIAGQDSKFNLLGDHNTIITLPLHIGWTPRSVAASDRATERPVHQHNSAVSHSNWHGALPHFDTKRALVKAQDGCDFCCAYCIVPAARGAPRSRPINEIVDEVKALADCGFVEVVLTGANLGCYNDDGRQLVQLVKAVEEVAGVRRIRLSSIEVSTTEKAIIDHMADSEKLCRYVHIPLQSGDDRILTAMGRRYTSAQYRALVDYAVGKVPYLGIGTDIIVGFPGEDDEAFANTEELVKKLPFSNLHVFSYSKRPGTRAADMPNQVPESTKKARSARLIRLGEEKRSAFAERFIGKSVSVLVEQVTSKSGTGWTSEYIEAQIHKPNLKPRQIIEFIPSNSRNAILE